MLFRRSFILLASIFCISIPTKSKALGLEVDESFQNIPIGIEPFPVDRYINLGIGVDLFTWSKMYAYNPGNGQMYPDTNVGRVSAQTFLKFSRSTPNYINVTRVEFTVYSGGSRYFNLPSSQAQIRMKTWNNSNENLVAAYPMDGNAKTWIIDAPTGDFLREVSIYFGNLPFITNFKVYSGASTQNIDLKIDSISSADFADTADGKFSVSPSAHDVIVKVSGTGFDANETRTTEISLQVGSMPPILKSIDLAQIKAAGTDGYLAIFSGVPFSVDQVGALNLVSKINPSNVITEIDSSNNSNTLEMYVLCNVEDSGKTIQYFAQGGSSAWANDDYANQAPKKMKSLGCYTTSFSMLMDFYGIRKSADGFSPINPGSVNAGLNLIGYYSELGPNYSGYNGYVPSGGVHPIGAVNFARASYAKECIASGGAVSVCKSKAAGKISYIERADKTNTTDPALFNGITEINKQLCAGNPIILKMPSIRFPNDPKKTHFILGKGITVNSSGEIRYITNDPANINGSGKDFLVQKENIRGYRLYKQISDPSMISIHLIGGLNMIVTDPTGRRSGYDSRTNQFYNEIPGATYTQPESIDSPEGDLSTVLESTFEHTTAINGSYQVQILGDSISSKNYQIIKYSFDDSGNINGISEQKEILPVGQNKILSFEHSSTKIPVRYASLNISKALFYDTSRNDKAFISGKITLENGRLMSKIDKFVSFKIGAFYKSIDLKRIFKLKIGRQNYYLYYDWGRKGLAFEINADTGEFVVYFDNIDLDDAKPNLTTGINIQIDDIQAENIVTFKDVKRRKNGK